MILDILKNICFTSLYGAVGISMYVTFNDFVFTIAHVEGASMEPTLNPKDKKRNDIVFLNRWSVDYNNMERGDIVALTDPRNKDSRLIKRIIGLEGDFIRTPRYKYDYTSIPRGHCWLEGDNKFRSLDSNSFGTVSLGLIEGKATHIIWPPSRWGRLSNEIPSSRYPLHWDEYVKQQKNLRNIDGESQLKCKLPIEVGTLQEFMDYDVLEFDESDIDI